MNTLLDLSFKNRGPAFPLPGVAANAVLLLLGLAVGTGQRLPAADQPGAPAAYAVEPQFRLLRFGEVMPTGWIREQVIRDLMNGFAGHLPEIAPNTCGDLIFGVNRNTPDHIQNAGGGSWGGAEGAWWKGET